LSWMIALLVFAIGLAAGTVLTYLISDDRRRTRELRRELDQVSDDYAAFRKDVSDHFTDTAVAVNQLTESYREVHEQLRRGARRLCDNATAETALAFDRSRLIGEDKPAGETPSHPSGEASATTLRAEAAETPGTPVATTQEATPPAPTDSEPDAATVAQQPKSDDASPAPAAPAPEPPRDYVEVKGTSVH